MNHCVDLMALFTKVAALVVSACAMNLTATKVHTLGSGTAWYTIGHVLAVGCSDSDLSMNTCLNGVRTGTAFFFT